jgi:hypothetical protein
MPLFTIRAALVLLVAAVVGMVAFALSFAASHRNAASSALVGFGAAGAALVTFNNLLAG